MRLTSKIEKEGNFLFRWRSFVPLVMLLPAFVAFSQSPVLEEKFGLHVENIWLAFSFLVSISGLVIRGVTVGFVPAGTSGRNAKYQRADHLNVTGMYSIVRNPLYLGNFLAWLGAALSVEVWWFVLIFSLAFWVYIERVIAAEEKFLTEKYGEQYTTWADKTPIFLPKFSLWQKPEMPFSLKTVLRREYNGLMAVCCAFFVIHFVIDVFFEGKTLKAWANEDWIFIAGLAMGSLVFFTFRALKKYTTLLRVDGR